MRKLPSLLQKRLESLPARASLLPHLARTLRTLLQPRRPSRPSREVHQLTRLVASEPALCQWVLVIACETRRIQRALLRRACRAAAEGHVRAEVLEAFHRLGSEPAMLWAVVEQLFSSVGEVAPQGTERQPRHARVRLAELRARLAGSAVLVS